ncbi:MAG: HD domain-containing protein [Thermoleophilaceae bacterium]|nr:HD domain-containing protein [Thermoleophilaceae bacterium]
MSTETEMTIAALQPGADIDAVFACVRKQLLTARNGSQFLQVELRDASGRITGRAFRDAPYLDGRFDQGDVVSVKARVEDFRGQLQLAIRSIERAETTPDAKFDLLPRSYRDIEELDGFFEHLAREVTNPQYSKLLAAVVGHSALRTALRTAPCTRDGHHAYLGGLLEHTVAVGILAQQTCDLHRRLNSDLLITAALLHDIGKTREFEYGAEIRHSKAGELLGHMQLGVELIRELAGQARSVDEAHMLPLLNCVLSHHGMAPGQRFASPEALALYRLNALDASVKGALEHGALAGGSGDLVSASVGPQRTAAHAEGDVKQQPDKQELERRLR